MEKTWVSGAIELIKHADAHMNCNTAFDKRIAFISIDNSVEVQIRTFLALPKKLSNISVPKKEIDEAGNFFPKLLELLYKYAASNLSGIDESDIEHYHRLRNKLYHEGTGLSIDEEYLRAYRGIAGILLQNLFNVQVKDNTASEEFTLQTLILNWNKIEKKLKSLLEASGVATTHQWWEKNVILEYILEPKELQEFNELRTARNTLVHSTVINKNDVKFWGEKSEAFLEKLCKVTDAAHGNDETCIVRKCSFCGRELIKSKDGKTYQCSNCSK